MNSAIVGSPWVFSEGMAAVVIKNHMGFINRNGNVEIEPKFTGADGFSEGLAAVAVKNKYGFIDRYGTMVLEPKYDFALAFSEGLATVQIENQLQIIDKAGNVVVDFGEEYTDVGLFSCGLATAEVGFNNNGFIDRSGKMVIEPKFFMAFPFIDGLALVTLTEDGKSGFIDTTGRFVIQPQFDEAESFSEGVAPVKKDGVWSFIDKNGAEVTRLGDRFDYVMPLYEGYSRVEMDGKYGIIDKEGNLLVDAKFDNLNIFSEGLAYARIGDTHGYINYSGNFEFQKPVPKPTLIDKLRGRKDWLRW